MLIGYARVSKADGGQFLDLQRDALVGAGVEKDRIYEDRASGRRDHRPGLEACLKALQPGNTLRDNIIKAMKIGYVARLLSRESGAVMCVYFSALEACLAEGARTVKTMAKQGDLLSLYAIGSKHGQIKEIDPVFVVSMDALRKAAEKGFAPTEYELMYVPFDHEFFGVGVPAGAFCHDRMRFTKILGIKRDSF